MYFGVALNFWYPLITLLTASKKSFSVTVFRRALMAYMPASVHTLRMSAPVLLGHNLASSSKRMSRSHDMVRVWICKQEAKGLVVITAPWYFQLLQRSCTEHTCLETCELYCREDSFEQVQYSVKPCSLQVQCLQSHRTWKICVLLSKSGNPNSTLRSKRPGRSNAGSNVSGLLVAISTCKQQSRQELCCFIPHRQAATAQEASQQHLAVHHVSATTNVHQQKTPPKQL